MNAIERAGKELSRLPGIGPKTALRLVYHLLKADPARIAQLTGALTDLADRVRPCERCGNYSDSDLCDVCSNPRRDHTTVCVVEEAYEVGAIERTGQYPGVYHVLGGKLSPLDGVGPESLRIAGLRTRVAEEGVREVILATNASMEGEATAVYLESILRNVQSLRVTRLARGIPVGSDLEYVDGTTIAEALLGRREM